MPFSWNNVRIAQLYQIFPLRIRGTLLQYWLSGRSFARSCTIQNGHHISERNRNWPLPHMEAEAQIEDPLCTPYCSSSILPQFYPPLWIPMSSSFCSCGALKADPIPEQNNPRQTIFLKFDDMNRDVKAACRSLHFILKGNFRYRLQLSLLLIALCIRSSQ